MAGLVNILLGYGCFQSHESLKTENVVLRHQLNILRRKVLKRPKLSGSDRMLFVWLYRLFPGIADAITIVRPETLIRWHRAGFRAGTVKLTGFGRPFGFLLVPRRRKSLQPMN